MKTVSRNNIVTNDDAINRWIRLFIFGIIMGVIGGLFAVLLRLLINIFEYFFISIFLPFISFKICGYNVGYIFLPTLGGLIVGLIIHYFAEETKGSGIPYLLESMALKGAHIRPKVGFFKTIVSAITIGSGGNAGKEGPIALIAASFGSFFGKLLKMKKIDKRLLMTCGLAAGISGTFNAPLGGAFFGLEILFQGASIITIIPVFLASVIGSLIAGLFFGHEAGLLLNFDPGNIYLIEYGFFILLGIIIGFIGFYHSKLFHLIKHGYEKLKCPNFIKPALGGLVTGIIIMFFPDVGLYGSGFNGIQMALNNQLIPLLMLLLGILKIITTTQTIGSGGSGGVFAPILYIGCMFGGAYGFLMKLIFPNLISNPLIYCLLGSAALFAASAQAPLNISLILTEITQYFIIFPPLLITSVVSYLIARIFFKGSSIYTIILDHEGIKIKTDTIFMLDNLRVNAIMSSNLITVSPDLPILEFAQVSSQNNDLAQFPVMNYGKLEGIAFIDALYSVPHENWEKINVREIMSKNIEGLNPDDTLQKAIDLMHEKNVRALLVTEKIEFDSDKSENILKGILTFEDIVKAWKQTKI